MTGSAEANIKIQVQELLATKEYEEFLNIR